MGSGFGAGAGANALRDVLMRLHTEQLDRQNAKRQQEQDAENTRRWDQTYARQVEADKGLADARAAEAARDRAAADKDANRAKGLGELSANPAAWQALNPLQRVLALQQYGVNNVPFHEGIETPEEHSKHVAGEKAAGLADFTEREKIRGRFRLAGAADTAARADSRATAKLRIDNPQLPIGAESYIAQIGAKHGGDVDSARQELDAYLSNPQTRSDHPNLSAVKAYEALRDVMARPAGAGPARPGGASVFASGAGAASTASAASGPVPSGRGGGSAQLFQHSDGTIRAYPPTPTAPGTVASPGAQSPQGSKRVVSVNGVPIAGRKPTTGGIPPAARDKAAGDLRQALGRDVTDADLQKFFASPQNRAHYGIQ